tara:strand:- start:204 stop:659 length:456 start_codon:yes stop_codon:yes gene_type:complete
VLRNEISNAYKSAMKQKEAVTVSTLRLILAAIKDRDIAARLKGNSDGITNDEILSLMQSMIKQRGDSIDAYEKGGRMELAHREAEEIAIIEGFLPAQMTPETVLSAVEEVIKDVNAETLKDMGKVMATLKQRFAGQMDFAKASSIVKGKLG